MLTERTFVITRERRAISIQIQAAKNWFFLVFGTIWLTGWTIGGITTIGALIGGRDDWPLLVLWLCGWVVGETFVSLAILWTAFGEEIISIREGSFEHVRHIFGFGRRRSIPLRKLSRLRPKGPFPKSNSISSSSFRLLFEGSVMVRVAPGETYRFGINLDRYSARYLVAELKPYFYESKKPADPLAQPQLEW